ncbi:indolepyruvate oxidoreductase subunit beta [Natranaerobius thermophilus]|uniref:Pyruvate ferredoxin/flavodoxin oxidoreductase n=1 Tax=Natranaerobius thermophilus (strain ATCC BAA-1301 / DSM 18059 / JW/NM-WN-LF) TaxID=457570 RepID=B2A2V7_NATTJ|nr:indolepyruvate oxidoreductase subunit beta [Natranaerobius thermophilus]ACB86325.1 pyruvate ferredoxin/flavodoxin oxidoreductase [Natranaerobius thermophilus JW/NM-WN-LF]
MTVNSNRARSTNIILCGVGGQGLVLTTKVIADAALNAGYDFKTTDVIGLAQRGGKVWGSVKISQDQIFSPNIPEGEGHFMIATEPLEALRWLGIMSPEPKGYIFVNTKEIHPSPVLLEQEEYPVNYQEQLSEKCNLTTINAFETGKKFGTEKLANTLLVGMLAAKLEIPWQAWLNSLRNNVPAKYSQQNEKALEYGYNYVI